MEIAVALGGGGARGSAHIGVLRVLERAGFQIRAIAGTSIGGVMGAVYAAGYSPDEVQARLSEADQSGFFRRDPDSGPSLLGLAGVAEMLVRYLGDTTCEDLSIPFAATAVDLITGQEVVLRQGRVVDVLMATIAVPGIFPPREWDDYLLVDGGVSNPVPVTVARSLAPGLPVVAVPLTLPPKEHRELPRPNYFGPLPVLKRIARLRVAQAFNIFVRSIDISGRRLTEMRLNLENPDFIIWPKVDHIGVLDRVEVGELVRLGEKAAEEALEDMRSALGWRGRLARRFGFRQAINRPNLDEP